MTLEVYVPQARNERQARRKLSVHLATWQAANPGVEAYIVDGPPQTRAGSLTENPAHAGPS
jgi:hypothetical protein